MNQARVVVRNGLRFVTLPALERAGFIHGFGTRDPGDSPGPARRAIKEAHPGLLAIASVKQVHGKNATRLDHPAEARVARRRRADMILTSISRLAVCVKTADCVPIIIIDPVKKAMAAVHSGWRSTALCAAERAVLLMGHEFGSRPRDLLAGIGPCIGPCHYQVDEPVIKAIREALAEKAEEVLKMEGPGRARLDLSLANRIILERAGVSRANVEEARMCTYCRDDLFFSYRRQGKGVPSLFHFVFRE